MDQCSEARPPAPRSDALRKIVTTKNIHSFDETIFLCALHSHPTALMQRKWIVLCSRGRPQLISYPRKWFDSCMHPRPERWCWLRRAAAGLRAGYTGTRAQTVPAALLLRVRVGSGGRESKLRLGLPAPSRVPLHWPEVPSAQDAGQAKTCAPSTPSLAQRRDPGQDVCAQHHVPGAAHSIRKNARSTSRADTQFQARAPKHPDAPDAALHGNAITISLTQRKAFVHLTSNSSISQSRSSDIEARPQNEDTHLSVFGIPMTQTNPHDRFTC